MIMNICEQKQKYEFYRLIKWIRNCLDMRILGFPDFKCYLRSELYSPRYNENLNYLARAHSAGSNIFRRLPKSDRNNWVIEFNDFYDETYDVEMVLYHELAHFVARKVDRQCPSHGMLWAAACDAIQMQMEMDEDSLEEGTYWISQVETLELEFTLRSDGLDSIDEWESVRCDCQKKIQREIKRHSNRVHYEDLCEIVARCAF